MARYNTVVTQNTISSTPSGGLASPNSGLFTEFTGTSYNVTVPDPTLYAGATQTFYNAASGTITLQTGTSATFNGPGASGTSSFSLAAGSTATLTSDGTNYILVSQNGGAVATSSLTVSGNLTANGSNATISFAPTGTGTITINPATAGTVSNVAVSATTLSASSTVGLRGTNAVVTISPTGASGRVVISSPTANSTAGAMDNINIGATTRGTGAFTTLAANGAVTLTGGGSASAYNTAGAALLVTGGVGISGATYTNSTLTTNGQLTVSSGGANITGGATVASGLTVTSGGFSITGTATFEYGNFVKARYAAGSDNYASYWAWYGLQLGNNGDNFFVAGSTATGGQFKFYVNNTTAPTSSSNWAPNGTLALTIGSNANCTFAGTITENSSIVYKENVNPIMGALDAITSLVGVTYDRKSGTNKNEAGLIAEEVYKVLPNLVEMTEDGKPHGIMYTKLTAYLIEAVKSLKAEIDSLKK